MFYRSFSALLISAYAHSELDSDADACTDAISYIHYAERCAADFTQIMYFSFYDFDSPGFFSGSGYSGSGASGFFYEYFYRQENEWNFTDWDSHICT